jgi:hypothetical protein
MKSACTFWTSRSGRWTSLLLVLFYVAASQAVAKRKPKLDPGDIPPADIHELREVFTRVGDACVGFSGWITDSPNILTTLEKDYFAGLKRVDTPQGPAFYRGSQPITDFPDELYILAYSSVARCSKNMKKTGEWPTATPEFLKNLRAEAVYIRDLERHPVEITEIEEGGVYMGVNPMLQFPTYSYHWVLKTKGIRLTDPLVVDLFSKDGTKVGRFSVNLGRVAHP